MFKPRGSRLAKVAMVASLATGIAVSSQSVAWANAPNPNPSTTLVSATTNGDGSVTVTIGGTWTWIGQPCAGRFAEGWAVDWWGISTSKTPSPSFSLTNASTVVYPNGLTTSLQTVSPAGAIQIKGSKPPTFFHVPQFYAGQIINNVSDNTYTTADGTTVHLGTCTTSGKNSSGNWSATATYPNASLIPPRLCVNMYDPHGSINKQSGSAKDYSAVNDDDNSILTNAFDPSVGSGFCTSVPPPSSPASITLSKTVCGPVTASNDCTSPGSSYSSSVTVPAGSKVLFHFLITNTGSVALTNITTNDAALPSCGGPVIASLDPGASTEYFCGDSLPATTQSFTNTASATGTPPSGPAVTSPTSSATVNVSG